MENCRKSPRASWIDYNEGVYFVTICTAGRAHCFGEIEGGEMQLSDVGRFAETQLMSASRFNPDVEVPLFVVMPNHIHFVVRVDGRRDYGDVINGMPVDMRSPNGYYRANGQERRIVPTLSRYVSQLKGAVTKYANRSGVLFAWQPRYYDEMIRSADAARNVEEYINNNVARWAFDKYCE